VSHDSSDETKKQARRAFMEAWNYGFTWMTLIVGDVFGDVRTNMGHAEYAAGGGDYDARFSCPFGSPEEVLAFDPYETFGVLDKSELVRDFEEHYRSQCRDYPNCVHMTGTYITLVSGLIDLFGWEMLLMAAAVDIDGFGEVTNRYAGWMQQYYDALAEADIPVVMSHDDITWTSGAFIKPEWYTKYVFPNYKKLYAPVVESGKILLYTSDGNYTQFIDDIVECGVSGFVLEPVTDMAYIAERYGKTHAFVGNADTRILLSGSKDDIRAEVERCMNIGKGCPGFFMAVGNHIPANTPVENALYYNEIYEKLSFR
ncbi:MAG: hypothetical protein M1305_07745, partial [Candidatus Marsarchaeota archaeon]|nr:hypothetical protein [Candidatus Marsarchaeota archaeon]